MYFLSLTLAVSPAAIVIGTTRTPPNSVLQTNFVSGRADPVLEGSMDTNIQGTLLSESHVFVQGLIHFIQISQLRSKRSIFLLNHRTRIRLQI